MDDFEAKQMWIQLDIVSNKLRAELPSDNKYSKWIQLDIVSNKTYTDVVTRVPDECEYSSI